MTLLLPLVALCLAMALPAQAAINAQLARALGSPLAATAVSFATGAVAMALVTLAVARDAPLLENAARTPLWILLAGGVLGATYVLGNIVLVPRLGAATLFAFAIAGQLAAALAMDQFGLLGLAVREASPGRLAGALMVLAGAVMVRVL
ncbi:DMT family transporter [Alsobacter sp. SYSU M60028]|uniref:DMT family transporter n=1 Tax=Alsobacter ponti TaxID=2962936 RepID=A0ABT1LHL3_9HYPH|nr:DMT family transporter [Alsobacter ponti]MCP8940586.1 DMT family transporter [Alsobacter ponti]